MEKIRVYELAKKLNTTSKRLIEKIQEINIDVKNHMSLIEGEELERLYEHVGYIKKLSEPESIEKTKQGQADAESGEKRSGAGDIPQIIRKTRIVIETQPDKSTESSTASTKKHQRHNVNTQGSSGLRPGFVYDASRPDTSTLKQKKQLAESENKEEKKSIKENIKKPEKTESTVEVHKEVKSETAVKPKKVTEATKKQPQTDSGVKKEIPIKKVASQEKQDVKNGGAASKKQQPKANIPAEQEIKASDKDKAIRAVGKMQEKDAKKNYDKFSDRASTEKGGRTNRAQSYEKTSEKEKRPRDISKKSSLHADEKFGSSKLANIKKNATSRARDGFSIDEDFERGRSKPRKRPTKASQNKTQNIEKHIPQKAVLTHVVLPEQMTVKELAEALKKTAADVIKKLIAYGVMATINQVVDYDIAALVADEYGITAEKLVLVSEEDILFDDSEDKPEELVPRPPVVVVMGHVDHGKTSLLDAIRKTDVIKQESGGITQHIGAYMVKTNNRKITFLDTPGHEAFTAMRARGAQVTDIAVLVVAADDGVMPQTIEAINHAKAANVSIIVAINKIDKPEANPDKIKQDLTEYGLVAEEWGGDTIFVPVSAKQMQNIDGLLEMITLVADVLELKANPNRQAKGTVIEARLDKNKGPVATLLVQRGTLKVGESIVTGTTVGRNRAMSDDKGNSVKAAGPSIPVEVLGFPEVPEAGEIFYAITDEKVAKQLVEKRRLKQREEHMNSDSKISLDDLFNQIQQGHVKDLNVIIKADVQGSVEAVEQSLLKLSNEDVRIKIIHGGVGAVTESDVKLAEVSNAIITGFNVRPAHNVMEIADSLGVDIRLYRVIYNAIEDIKAAMKGMLEPKFKEVILGHAEIRQVFKITGAGMVAGCYVTDGKIPRNSEIRVVRGGIVVHEGKINSLKRMKDDVKEVAQGFECGIAIERFNDIKDGDIIEAFEMQEIVS